MNKNELQRRLLGRKIKDYSFSIGFFLIFSFFIIFVIKPNISLIFSLQKQKSELTNLDNNYQAVIMSIVDVQSKLENARDNLYLLTEAIPAVPDIGGLVNDVSKSASNAGLIITKFNIDQVDLKHENSDKANFSGVKISLEGESDFKQAQAFINRLLDQRRLKKIRRLTIANGLPASSGSAALKVQFELDGYYL